MDPVDGKIATLHGYSIVPTADMPTMTTGTYPIMFANLRMGYKIIDKPTTSVLRDPYSSKPKVLFYFTKRTGGGVTKAEAIVPIKCATS
jgi:HK97 family phage major capsid protein